MIVTLSWPLMLTLLGSVSLFGAIVNSNIALQRFRVALVLLTCGVALYFVGQYSYFFYPYEQGLLADWARRSSLWLPNMAIFTPHPNAIAGFLEEVWLLSIVLMWQAQARQRFWWGLAVVIISYSLFITGSRGAALGIAVTISLWLWLPLVVVIMIAAYFLDESLKKKPSLMRYILAVFGLFWLVRDLFFHVNFWGVKAISAALIKGYGRVFVQGNSLANHSDPLYINVLLIGIALTLIFSVLLLALVYREKYLHAKAIVVSNS